MFLAIFLCVYVSGILVLGFYLRKRAQGLSGFLVARRKLSLTLTTLSLTASIIGASMTITAVSNFHEMGLSAIWFILGPSFFLLLMGLLLAERIRRTRALTLPDLVEKIFSTKAKIVTSILVIIAEILWIAVLVTASRDILNAFLGISPKAALIGSMAVFSLYTLLAGKVADAYSDAIQAVMMALMAFTLVIAISMSDGFNPGAIESTRLNIFYNHTPISLFSMLLLLGLSYLVGPDVYSAILSARSERIAKRSAVIGAGIIAFWGLIMAFIGVMASEMGLAPSEGSVINQVIIGTVSSSPLRAFLVAGLIAVMMSSVDTTLLTSSSVLSNDIVGTILKRRKSINDKKRNRIIFLTAKISILPLALISILVGIWLEDMIEILYLAYLLFISSAVLPVAGGLLKRYTKVNDLGAITGMLSGGISALVWYLSYRNEWLSLSWSGWLYDQGLVNSTQLVGLLFCLLGMLLGSVAHVKLSSTN